DVSLLNPTGVKTGHCTACDRDIVKDIAYEPVIWNANDKTSGNAVDKRLYSKIREEDHFYPTETNPNGNDLLIEFSILYNETLSTLPGASFDITVGDGSDFVNVKLSSDANARYGTVVGGFSARDRNDGKGAILSTPSAAAIEADPNAKYPSIGDYGWHRVAVRVHQEADIVEDAVAYTYTGEAYLDGNLILAFDLSKWASGNTGVLLYTATIEDGHLVYADNDAANAWGEIAIYDFYKSADIYCAIADTYMTCGQDFIQEVVPAVDPADATLEVAESVELPAKMWYVARHEHVAAAEYTIDTPATCTTPGSKSYHCTVCGVIIADTVTPVEPTGDAHVPAAEFTVDTPATCTDLGSRSKHCTVCGEIIAETVEPVSMLAHTPATEYTVDLAATCTTAGSKSKRCTVCDAIIADTVTPIDVDPDAHVVTDWTTTVEASLLADGSKNGDCTLCGANVVKVVAYVPTVLKSSDKSKGTWDVRPTFATIQGEQHFYPDESNGNLGNDLLIEFSILWNDTMATVYGSGSTFDIGVNDGSDIANIDLQSATSGNFSAKERTGTTYVYPTPAAIEADASVKHPTIGANGWHRVGVRVHQEAAIVADAVKYTYLITVYLDGEMILKYDSSAWATSTPGALLFTATIKDGNLVYADNTNSAAKANITIVDYYKGSGNYLVIADEYMTCGTDFVQQVEAVADPAAATFSPAEGVELSAAMYFKAKAD
ncbi:MAG: hypothetical protein IKP55_07725, partial [Clostridia bacterium]|nr:hypothetical protein [Clostridia bacterium]